MSFRLFRASPEQVMLSGPVEEKSAPPNSGIPREVWLKHLIESYRRQCNTIDKLAGYAKGLEQKLDVMHQKYTMLERSYNEMVKLERTKEYVMKENSRIALYKSIIKSQFFHIHYLHTVLHLNRITFNKKGAYTMQKTKLVERIIGECLSAKSVNPNDV